MAVYTQLEFGEIEALAAPLQLGRLTAAQGVTAGVENTTYFLEFATLQTPPTKAEYVLTVAETLDRSDLEFIAMLTHDLHNAGLPVPGPVFRGSPFSKDSAVLSIRGKPAVLVSRIAGEHPHRVTPELCGQIGRILASMHLVTRNLGYGHESHRSLAWVANTATSLLPRLRNTDRGLLEQELAQLNEFVSINTNLPQAIIHGDLFRDNVLISHGSITALIDFFSAGTGYLLLDLAIVVNDWCFDADGNLNSSNYDELVRNYCAAREPEVSEYRCWSQVLRIAALRFWVSRLNEQLLAGPHAPPGRGKDPASYRRLILIHRASSLTL